MQTINPKLVHNADLFNAVFAGAEASKPCNRSVAMCELFLAAANYRVIRAEFAAARQALVSL